MPVSYTVQRLAAVAASGFYVTIIMQKVLSVNIAKEGEENRFIF